MGHQLTGGDIFPSLTLNIADGSTVNLPGEIETPLAVVLFYRGHW